MTLDRCVVCGKPVNKGKTVKGKSLPGCPACGGRCCSSRCVDDHIADEKRKFKALSKEEQSLYLAKAEANAKAAGL